MDRRTAALCFRHHRDNSREQGVGANLFHLDDEPAGAVDGGADDSIARLFLDRYGFSGDHRLIYRTGAFQNTTVEGHLLTGPDPQTIPKLNLIQRHIFLVAVRSNASCRLGGEAQQLSNRRVGRASGSEFQDLTQ